MDSKAATEVFSNLDKLQWATESFTLLQLMDSLELPQVVKVTRSSSQDVRQNEFILLQSVFDRYLLLGNQVNTETTYLIPDWYRAKCKIVTQNPNIQKQFWNFQGASEINRFDLPREINFLVETPIYQLVSKSGSKCEWKKVCLKRNTRLLASKLQQYSVNNTKQGPCFILLDKRGNQYLLPADFNIKFSVQIQKDEYNNTYFDHKSTFTLPEVITRYDLPVVVEFTQSDEVVNAIPKNKLPTAPVKLTSVAIAKSLIGVLLNTQSKQQRFVELSPATPVDLAIPKCLQKGLKNPNAQLTPAEEKEYTMYNQTREAIMTGYNKTCELYKYDLRSASTEEKDAMAKIFEAGKKYKQDESKVIKDNFLLNVNSNDIKNPDIKIPFINSKCIFLRPNIDEGDPYDDVNHEAEGEENAAGATHDIQALNAMPDKLVTDIISEVDKSDTPKSSK